MNRMESDMIDQVSLVETNLFLYFVLNYFQLKWMVVVPSAGKVPGYISTLVSGVEENSLTTSPELSLLLYSLSEHPSFCTGEYTVMDRFDVFEYP